MGCGESSASAEERPSSGNRSSGRNPEPNSGGNSAVNSRTAAAAAKRSTSSTDSSNPPPPSTSTSRPPASRDVNKQPSNVASSGAPSNISAVSDAEEQLIRLEKVKASNESVQHISRGPHDRIIPFVWRGNSVKIDVSPDPSRFSGDLFGAHYVQIVAAFGGASSGLPTNAADVAWWIAGPTPTHQDWPYFESQQKTRHHYVTPIRLEEPMAFVVARVNTDPGVTVHITNKDYKFPLLNDFGDD